MQNQLEPIVIMEYQGEPFLSMKNQGETPDMWQVGGGEHSLKISDP